MWEYRATVAPGLPAAQSIHDADTLLLLVDTGFGGRSEISARLADVSAPELNQQGGTEARDFTVTWATRVVFHSPLRWPLRVLTETTTVPEPTERRSFVRYIATVYAMVDGECLNDVLSRYLAGHPAWPPGKDLT